MTSILSYFANPARFDRIAQPVRKICAILALPVLAIGLYAAFTSPPDYQQSDAVRIMYVHVPCAWLSLMIYASLAVAAFSLVVWKHLLAGVYLRAAAPVGAMFTALCLITGSLWGYPMWGTWWVWDARLTSVLILFFLYLGVIALLDAFDDRAQSQTMAAWLALIGVVNLPIIKYSVEWWNTLHQPATISSLKRLADPALPPAMMTPLLLMTLAYIMIAAVIVLLRMENLRQPEKRHV